MVRKIHIDSDYTIQQWIDSQNTMSDYMGDLDNFEARFKQTALTTHPGYEDSSFVTALNFINDPWVEYLRKMFNGTGATKIEAELLVDSGQFAVVRLADSTDDYTRRFPRFSNFDTRFYAADSFIRASHADGDDPISTSIYIGSRWPNPDAPRIFSFNFDFYVNDSAWFNNIRVKAAFTDQTDSQYFDYINLKDSGTIGGITADSTGFVKIVFADIDSSSTIDSASIGLLRSNNILNDSSTFKILRITDTIVIDSNSGILEIDNTQFNGISSFLITDSAGASSVGDPGVIYFGAYKLDSV